MSDQVFWYLTRSAALLCWLAAAASMTIGLLMSTRTLGRRPTIPWLLDVHRFLSAMSVVFLGLHLASLWADTFVELTVVDLLVPGQARIAGLSSTSLAIGVVAAWLLVGVELSSLVKKWISPRTWHTIHLTSYGSLAAGAVHGIQVGSDTTNRLLIAVAASMWTLIALLTAIRFSAYLTDRKLRYDLEQGHADRDEGTDRPRRTDDGEPNGWPIERESADERYATATRPIERVPVPETPSARHPPPGRRPIDRGVPPPSHRRPVDPSGRRRSAPPPVDR